MCLLRAALLTSPRPALAIPERGDEPPKAIWGEFLAGAYNQVLQALGILVLSLRTNTESENRKSSHFHILFRGISLLYTPLFLEFCSYQPGNPQALL